MNKLLSNSFQTERSNNMTSGFTQLARPSGSSMVKKQGLAVSQPESLLGMALYDFDTLATDAGLYGNGSCHPGTPNTNARSVAPAFHPVDEYKDLSLKEILDLSDDFLSPDEDNLLGNSQDLFEPMALNSNSHMQQQRQQQYMQQMQQQEQIRLHQQQMQMLQQQQHMHMQHQQNMQMQMMMPSRQNLAAPLPPQSTCSYDVNIHPGGFPHDELADMMQNPFMNAPSDGPQNSMDNFSPSDELFDLTNDGNIAVPQAVPSGPCNPKKRSHETAVSEDEDACVDADNDNDYDEKNMTTEEKAAHDRRFRPYQAGQWSEKFEELCQYRDKMGHCLVPHTFSENLALARWVKRQRYQYKLMVEGKSSTMTQDRVEALEDIGFVWDSQGAAWGDRLHELRIFKEEFMHCNVPSNYCENPRLATWIKCQRRQYKLYQEGKPSNMTPQRIHELERLGFEWELRSYKKARTD